VYAANTLSVRRRRSAVATVDPLPGWHVGGGGRAMLKVAALGNLIAGWCGGMVAFALLVAAPASVHRSQLTRLAGGEAADGSPSRRGPALGKPRSRGFECRTGDGHVET
jgi:hypothetical protein